jgi:sigma-54 dependent transcriptional regulator, acetoin dehydrogenase operon transcriptional activator AcoR
MDDLVRELREQLMRVGLLGDVHAEGLVPDLILRSWRRSISGSVESASVSQRHQDVDTDSILYRAAEPVLDRWQHQLTDTGTTLFLSDRGGSIVARRASDSRVRRRLDEVNAAEGFDYSEDSVGTNGLGTSVVEKRAVFIQGSQHYNDALAGLACAAAPLITPSGSVIGSISLGGPVESSNPLMLSLTREIGQQIEERLRAASRPQDLALAMSFMRFTNSKRPTVVMDNESVLANTPGLPYVSVTSHVMLWEMLTARDWSRGGTTRFTLEGTGFEVVARRVLDGPRPHYVLHFSELADVSHRLDASSPASAASISTASAASVTGGGVSLIEGPQGSGRATAAHRLREAGTPLPDLDEVVVSRTSVTPWAQIGDLLASGTDVLLRRIEDVTEDEAGHLLQLVQGHRTGVATGEGASTLYLTISHDAAPHEVRRMLDGVEPTTRTQALYATPERIPGLVKRILDRIDPNGRHSLSPAALQAFMQWSWPGNISELADTLNALVREVPASVIQRQHLPAHLQQAPSRRQLTLIQAAERGAIIKALDAAAGNKSEAAALLGIGRTTLYRRLRQLGLDADEGSL